MRRHLAVLALVFAAGCTGPSGAGGPEVESSVPAAPTGFQVRLEHREEPAAGPAGAGRVSWETAWSLSWEPAAEAASYAVYYRTTEGPGSERPQRSVAAPAFEIQAAAGTSSPERLEQDRAAALTFASSQLRVAIAAVRPDGRQGPRSLWFSVGDVAADGTPVGAVADGSIRHP